MGNLMKFHTKDLPELMDRINRYSIGMDDYFDRLGTLHETQTNYPPYNLVQLSNVEYRLELALAGFKRKEINVYTCLLYTSPSPRDQRGSRMPSSA